MKSLPDFDVVTRDWLDDAPSTMPERALEATLAEIHGTRQVRHGALRRATGISSNVLRFAAAASLVIVVLGVAALVASRLTLDHSIGQLPPTTENVLPSPTATGATSLAPIWLQRRGHHRVRSQRTQRGRRRTWLVNPDGSNEAPAARRDGTELRWTHSELADRPEPVAAACSRRTGRKSRSATTSSLVGGGQSAGTWSGTWIVGLDGPIVSMVPMVCGNCGSIIERQHVPRGRGRPTADDRGRDVERYPTQRATASTLRSTCSADCGCRLDSLHGLLWQTQVTGATPRCSGRLLARQQEPALHPHRPRRPGRTDGAGRHVRVGLQPESGRDAGLRERLLRAGRELVAGWQQGCVCSDQCGRQ